MNCPKCDQPTEPGAAFCGNCGQALPANTSPIAQVLANTEESPAAALTMTTTLPAYAVATPAQHVGETKVLLSVVFGVIGSVGALIPLVGLGFGLAGVVMGTMARQSSKRKLSIIGIIASSIGILASLGSWTYLIQHDPALHPQKQASAASHQLPTTAIAATSLSTPCYSLGFTAKLNISNATSSCDMAAYNGSSLQNSSDLYKIYADRTSLTSAAGFTDTAKQAIEQDIQTNLPDFTIDSEKITNFSGSTAYVVMTSNAAAKAYVVEAAIYHPVSSGDNVFVLVHATTGHAADLRTLEAQWQWN